MSAFGAAAKRKLGKKTITGAPEDQLRAPLEELVEGIAGLLGHAKGALSLVGETTLAHLSTRPDYAVTLRKALIGFIEVKAPGTGADPRRFTDDHNKKQWAKLKCLPNLIYTDGNQFSLWRDGELQGKIILLEGDIVSSGAGLAAPPGLEGLFSDFFGWQPIPPRNAKQLAQVSARLCRLLREEVAEELEKNNPGLTSLGQEWRTLLFPEANNEQFADGYAQAVTFGLLVARVRNVDLSLDLDKAANELRKSSTLIGTALRLLVDDPNIKTALHTSLDTLRRVLNVVDWPTITKGNPEAWLYFYEDFLDVYDRDLKKRTGSYYTPPEVVNAMVRLTDEALRDPKLFNKPLGLAASSVTICDPAVGTGTYLLGVLRRIAATVEDNQGPGAVGEAVLAALDRILGFELQFGPFAVAQLRLIAEMQTLVGDHMCVASPKLYVTDTLGDPYATETQFSAMVAPIGESRKEANRVKRETPITVVIGNPPYKNQAAGLGGWIEDGSKGREAPMARWSPPPEWGIGAHTHHLKNLYVYFWRWATWKVFGSGVAATTGEPDNDRSGIVCFITVAGFLNGPGFQKMRDDLRRDCSAIWVIDCSPDGHQPEVNTRVFQGVQQPVCIVLAARTPKKNRDLPAKLSFIALPKGNRKEKFAALSKLSLVAGDWRDGPTDFRDSFLGEQEGAWADFPALSDFFAWSGSGVTPHRTWPISPDVPTLEKRWDRLRCERDPAEKAELFHADRDRQVDKVVTLDLGPYQTRQVTVAKDQGSVVPPVRYAFRSFDRQWIPPDNRLLSMQRPQLWDSFSDHQIFLTGSQDVTPTGPAISITSALPDVNYYHGRGGRVYPLWRDAAATVSNVSPDLLATLSLLYGGSSRPKTSWPISPPSWRIPPSPRAFKKTSSAPACACRSRRTRRSLPKPLHSAARSSGCTPTASASRMPKPIGPLVRRA
jgi:hypothetical protein